MLFLRIVLFTMYVAYANSRDLSFFCIHKLVQNLFCILSPRMNILSLHIKVKETFMPYFINVFFIICVTKNLELSFKVSTSM